MIKRRFRDLFFKEKNAEWNLIFEWALISSVIFFFKKNFKILINNFFRIKKKKKNKNNYKRQNNNNEINKYLYNILLKF